MHWSTALPLGYFGLCGCFALNAQLRSGPASERWLPIQGLTLPWGVAISYWSILDEWSEPAVAAVYLAAAAVNACLFFAGLRLFVRVIKWLERLDDRV